jgi:hypothetical protein
LRAVVAVLDGGGPSAVDVARVADRGFEVGHDQLSCKPARALLRASSLRKHAKWRTSVKTTRWIGWTNLALGNYLLCVPLLTTNSTNGSTVWVATSFGLFILAAAILALAHKVRLAAEWTQVVDGALLAASQSYSGSPN